MTEQTRSHRSDFVLAAILVGVAAVMAVSLAVAAVDPTGFFGLAIATPGRFFFAMLHGAAWWIPLYFAVLASFAARREHITWASVILLNLVHVPVLTIAALLRLLTPSNVGNAPLLDALERSFTVRGASLVLSLVLAVEGLALLEIWRRLDRRARTGRWEADADDDAEEAVGAEDHADESSDALLLPAPTPAAEEAPAVTFNDAHREPTDEEPPAAELPVDESAADEPAVEESPTEEFPDPEDHRSSFHEQLAALRRRMEPESDDAYAGAPATAEEKEDDDDPVSPPEGPLPLIFGHGAHRAPVTTEDRSDDEYDDDFEEIGVVTFDPDEDDDDIDDDPERDPVAPVDEVDEDDEDDEEPADAEIPPPPRRRNGGTRRPYGIPVEGILTTYSDGRYWEIDDSTRDAAEVLRVTLEEFGIKAEVTGIRKGPVITMFEILPAPGVKLAKITNLADNIALRLAASSVRIVAPIPGKHAVGIEIPNRERNIVSFAELLNNDEFYESDSAIPIALGKDIAGEAQLVDLTKTPHMLIAGATGSGKSVCVNSIICSVLYRRNPNEVKLILIDPKIVELKFYNDIPHLLTPVITDPKRAFQALQYLIYEMERRYSLLDSLGARDIAGFNAKIKRKNLATEPLPYIVVIIDEFADLMATSGKELESTVARLAAMSRAVGIHLVLATQRPSTDVITGLIKANIPSRIAFMVASKVDSRIIIDSMGAEKLLGRGDMLYTSAADPFPVRMQGAFLTEDEVERVVAEVKTFGEPEYIDDEIFIDEDEDDLAADTLEDPLMEKAIEVVTSSRKASASYLQRRLKVGYNRAARMVEEMERMGIVGPQNGSKPRDVISAG